MGRWLAITMMQLINISQHKLVQRQAKMVNNRIIPSVRLAHTNIVAILSIQMNQPIDQSNSSAVHGIHRQDEHHHYYHHNHHHCSRSLANLLSTSLTLYHQRNQHNNEEQLFNNYGHNSPLLIFPFHPFVAFPVPVPVPAVGHFCVIFCSCVPGVSFRLARYGNIVSIVVVGIIDSVFSSLSISLRPSTWLMQLFANDFDHHSTICLPFCRPRASMSTDIGTLESNS